jgi:threonine synthase
MDIKLQCIDCSKEYDALKIRYMCDCGGTLDVSHDLDSLKKMNLRDVWDARWRSRQKPYDSGVWRYKELIYPLEDRFIISKPEGNTNLYPAGKAGKYAGLNRFLLKHEGENPTCSFKDRGMTCGITAAKMMGAGVVACASTGNTSASMAAYAALAGMIGIIFIPEGKIAYGKLTQALAYGGKTLQIKGDFDDAMTLVQEVCDTLNIYLLNSINPFRIEGQKAIGFEILQQLNWEAPDWFILPGGNLGNNSALSKGLMELYKIGIIDKIPRIAVIQANGANPLYKMWINKTPYERVHKADTIATAIKIGNPVSWRKSLRGIEWSNGVVEQVTDQEIMDAKAWVDGSGIGAEPASCATVAGAKKLVEAGVIDPEEMVVGILTGHLLKDPDATVFYHKSDLSDRGIVSHFANAPIQIEPTLDAVRMHISSLIP